MRTSEHLATAAAHLAQLLRDGQDDLLTSTDLTLTARDRDQVGAGLGRALTIVLTRLDDAGGHYDAVQAARPLARTLAAWPGGDDSRSVPGPASLMIEEPAASSARVWARAAAEVRTAADQAERADDVPPDQWRASAVDLAALAGSLAQLDNDLAEAITAAGALGTPEGGPWRSVEALHDQARAALDALDGVDLPQEYHLTPPVLGVAAVTEPRHVPIAIRRVAVLLDRGPGLTAAQHTAVAIETAKLAHQLRLRLPAASSVRDAASGEELGLQRFVQAQLGVAHVWSGVSHLSCAHAGAWEAAAQLQAVNGFLAGPARAQLTALQAREAVRLLPGVVGSVVADFDEALAREDWTAAYRDRDDRTVWASIWPDYGPEARGLTPTVSDFAPVRVHLPGHTVHQAWHHRGIPVDGYRLGDPIEDRQVGAPQAIAELHRLYTAMEATAATGRGLLEAVDPSPRDLPDRGLAPAHEILGSRSVLGPYRTAAPRTVASAEAQAPAATPPRFIVVRGPHDLADGLHRLAALTREGERISTDRWKIIASTAAQAARDAAQALYRAAAPGPAAALLEQARLITDAAHAMSATRPAVYTGSVSLAQAQQIRRQLAVHRRAGTLLPAGPALNIARALPALTRALAETADRAAPLRAARPRSGTAARASAFMPNLARERMAAAVTHSVVLDRAARATTLPRPAPGAGTLSRSARR